MLAPVAFGSKRFTTEKMSLTMYAVFSNASSFRPLWTHLVGNQKKTIIAVTDKQALTRCIQAKRIPPSL